METIIEYIKIAKLICKRRLFGLDTPEQQRLDKWKYENFSGGSKEICDFKTSGLNERYNRINIDEEWKTFRKRAGKHRSHKLYYSFSAAAGVSLLLGISYIFLLRYSSEKQIPVAFSPQKHGVCLILSNGEQLSLSDEEAIPEGKIDGWAKVSENTLKYNSRNEAKADKTGENTLLIPAGAFYHLILADGTRVWLNSGSRITYPVAFTGETREVVLSGEAYFDVVKDKAMPFIVKTDYFDVKVLGTSFNINTYGDNGKAYTALKEGLVEISSGRDNIQFVRPGQVMELDIRDSNSKFRLSDIRIEQQLAWKEGEFCFRKTSLPEILKQVERYYNVRFINTSGSLDEYYTGTISRNVSLEVLLSAIEESIDVRFKISGETVCIEKKRD